MNPHILDTGSSKDFLDKIIKSNLLATWAIKSWQDALALCCSSSARLLHAGHSGSVQALNRLIEAAACIEPTEDINVPVFLSCMIKRLEQTSDGDIKIICKSLLKTIYCTVAPFSNYIVGTIIQRSLGIDLTSIQRFSGSSASGATFAFRVNDKRK